VHVKNFDACTGSREGLQFENKQKNLASAAKPAQTEGEQSISSFNVYDKTAISTGLACPSKKNHGCLDFQ
jgi:hypothetical protein